MDAGKNFLTAFIDCYELSPSLWDNSSPEYTSRHTKFIAYVKLLNIMKIYKEDATITDVKKKINTLRSNFRREMKRISMSEARGDKPLYTPNLWWFEKFSFLKNLKNFQECSIKRKISRKFSKIKKHVAKHEEVYVDEYSIFDEHQDEDEEEEGQEGDEEVDSICSQEVKLEDTSIKRQHIVEEPYIQPITKRIKNSDDNFLTNYNVLPTPSVSMPTSTQDGVIAVPALDTIDHMCKAWAGNLREMTKTQRIIAERAISEIIFQGQVGILTFDSIPKMPLNASSSQMQMATNNHSSEESGAVDSNEYSTQQQQQQQQSHHIIDFQQSRRHSAESHQNQNQFQHQRERLSTTLNPLQKSAYTNSMIKERDYQVDFYDQ